MICKLFKAFHFIVAVQVGSLPAKVEMQDCYYGT